MRQALDYWLWFSLKQGIKPARYIELLHQFGSPETIFHATKKQLKSEKLSAKERRILADKDMTYAEAVKERCKEVGIHILTYDNPAYPAKLKEIPDPPCVLYVRCKKRINLNDKICIAMVGTRDMTPYGEHAALEIATGFANSGVVVVSGMAAGIDTASHRGAINAGGLTVAVLGCGADIVYPRYNDAVMHAIIEHGMVISEFPPGTAPLKKNFPIRNRIISGLSEGVVVVEAPIRSGSLITADHAIAQNRELFAVPGDINRYSSRGCNKLINKGAVLVNSAEDVLKEYEFVFWNTLKQYTMQKKDESADKPEHTVNHKQSIVTAEKLASPTENPLYQNLSETQRAIVEQLSLHPVSLETLLDKTQLSIDELSTNLMLLEIDGIIKGMPGKHFVLNV